MRFLTPSSLLRIESAVVAVLAIVLYDQNDGSWLLFALVILAPDLSMLGYLAGNRLGAISYNLAHIFVGPGLLGLIGVAESILAISIALIWGIHILVDRVVGYGLKYEEGFKVTHLNRV